ncbi:MAG: deoxyribonuclease IV [Chloroflexia bacterium]
MPYLGAHMSIAGGVEQALIRGKTIGCEAVQIFTKQPNRWAAKPLTAHEIEAFARAWQESGIGPVWAHDAYLINLASPEEGLWEQSVQSFQHELERARALGLPYLVTHAGAHRGAGEAEGLRRIAQALDRVLAAVPEVMVLLETTAGQGGALCYRFEQIAWIIEQVRYPERLGVCFDTCHVFVAGYELRTREGYEQTLRELDERIGLERLKVFHLNDAKKGLGSRVDRHTHIGQGMLGLEPFRWLLNDPRFQKHPMVLETPKGPEMEEDRQNLAVLRSLLASSADQ